MPTSDLIQPMKEKAEAVQAIVVKISVHVLVVPFSVVIP